MGEQQDYSGDYNPDIEFEDLSKEALIRLLKAYQKIFVGALGIWNTLNRQRMSVEQVWKLDGDVYEFQLNTFELPLVTKALNIQGNDVATMLKY